MIGERAATVLTSANIAFGATQKNDAAEAIRLLVQKIVDGAQSNW